MKRSLSGRIFWTIFAIGLLNAAVTMIAVEWIYEDVEDTVLNAELSAEQNFIAAHIRATGARSWRSALLESIFVADGEPTPALPAHFADRAPPYSEEVEIGSTTYLVSITQLDSPAGTLYVAKNITLLEDREAVTNQTTLMIGVGLILLGFLIARQGTSRVVGPLRALNREIRCLQPQQGIGRIEQAYRETELAAIASTLNATLDDLDAYVKREKSLISLASHELRTPVAVITGALDVLEQRDSLGEADRRTLMRIRRATNEMRSDVDALLKLARRNTGQEESASVDLAACVGEVVADIKTFSPDTSERIACHAPTLPIRVMADRALVRMLLRNLIQNAVRHTRATVEVHIHTDRLLICDHGEGLPEHARARLGESSSSQPVPEDGLGLFIVRLICERLGWHIAADSSGPTGTEIELRFDTTSPGSSTPL